MFEQDLLGALAIEWYRTGEHFVEDDPKRVDVDFLAVFPFTDFGSHVMEGPDAFGLAGSSRGADVLRQAIVPDFG